MLGEAPLAVGDDVNDLMEEEAGDAGEEAYEAHHDPAVPVMTGWLGAQPGGVHLGRRVSGRDLTDY